VNPDSVVIPVAVLMERRKATSPWIDFTWRAIEVLEEVPPVAPWTVLRETEDGRTLFFAGSAEVALHPTDTTNYKHNLEAAQPLAWVILRHGDTPAGLALHGVTLDPGEAHLHADSGTDLLESLPMPPGLRAIASEFVARHHKEHVFHKRKRDKADPEALGRRPRLAEEEE
jgi:hypothetical protein